MPQWRRTRGRTQELPSNSTQVSNTTGAVAQRVVEDVAATAQFADEIATLCDKGMSVGEIARRTGVRAKRVQIEKDRRRRAAGITDLDWEDRLGVRVRNAYNVLIEQHSRYRLPNGTEITQRERQRNDRAEYLCNPYELTPAGVRKAFKDGLLVTKPPGIGDRSLGLLREMAGLPPEPIAAVAEANDEIAKALVVLKAAGYYVEAPKSEGEPFGEQPPSSGTLTAVSA